MKEVEEEESLRRLYIVCTMFCVELEGTYTKALSAILHFYNISFIEEQL